MKYFYRLSALFLLFPFGLLYAEDAFRKIILVEEAKRVSTRDIRKASTSESEKNQDGGYNANVNVIDCFAAMEYRYTGGRYIDEPIKFRMLFPDEMKSGKKYPLVIWFHGVGESGEDNTRQLSHVQLTIEYLAGKNKLDFFMIVTQCPSDNRHWETSISDEGKGDTPMTIVEEIIEVVIKEYPIDENRLSAFGLCSGGNAAWNIVTRHPGKFAAMVACTASPGSASIQDFRNTAVWTFTNKDDPVPWEAVERFVNAINADGGRAHVTLKDTGGHDAWSNALRNEKVIGWMILQDLQKGGPPTGVICYHRTAGQVFLLFGLPMIAILCVIPFYRRKRDVP
jgi:predicted peptidase